MLISIRVSIGTQLLVELKECDLFHILIIEVVSRNKRFWIQKQTVYRCRLFKSFFCHLMKLDTVLVLFAI